jgi:hypothetical protein
MPDPAARWRLQAVRDARSAAAAAAGPPPGEPAEERYMGAVGEGIEFRPRGGAPACPPACLCPPALLPASLLAMRGMGGGCQGWGLPLPPLRCHC